MENNKTINSKSKKLYSKKKIQELQKYKIDVTEKLNPPEIAWCMENEDKSKISILGTMGNFSLIIGKAKSRKTFFISLVASALISNKNKENPYKGKLPKNKNEVYIFDTEQGKYHVQLMAKRVINLAKKTNPKKLSVYGLRSLKPKTRLDYIENAIYENNNLGLVIIDGIKDLITSINSEEEATKISNKLLKWTEETNIHIIVILHQNKGDRNARGHIGTELVNKSETVLSVTKQESDKDVSLVEAEMCRNEEPKEFAFEIINGLPVKVDDYERRKKTKNVKKGVLDIDDEKKYKIIKEAFSHNDKYKYSDLIAQIKIAYENQINKRFGNNVLRDFINYCKNKKWLLQERERQPYTLGTFTNTKKE